MKKINILPPSIFNLLAAGEVVENPAAVVKECVENSLDAGASKIEIAIENGGLDCIRIADNGHGVSASEIEKVFMPHATSKVAAAHDLEKISTLGFRGEALSSIAAVSQIVFTTKSDDDKTAVMLTVEAGKVTGNTYVSANTGTSIEIKNLFFNTPARKKFLKSTAVEKNNVTATVQKLILANPEVSFNYTIDSNVLYNFKGKTLLDAIQAGYEDIVADKLIKIETPSGKYSLTGYVSKPTFSKRNRTYQTVMVNGRPVEGGTISDAVNAAYVNYLTVGNFPFFVLNFGIDVAEVDVNVHPRKIQVKFSNENEVFEFVRLAIIQAVDAHLHGQNSIFIEKTDLEKPESKIEDSKSTEILQRIKYFSSAKPNETAVKSAPNIMNKYDLRDNPTDTPQEILSTAPKQIHFVSKENDFKILGTIFDTYILISQDGNFIIIDQHAAHERLLYDELKKQIDSNSVAVQHLLEPSVLVLNPDEMTRMEEAAKYLNEMGIECNKFGNNVWRLTAVPVSVLPHGIDTVINNVLHDIKNTPPDKLSSVLQDKIITQCCKNAIKAKQSLNYEQISLFLKQFKTGVKTPVCPHGRPILITYTRDRLEKLFSRK